MRAGFLRGCGTALVTPFKSDGALDEKALREVGRWPWPRGRYAALIASIGSAKPKQQVHDINFPDKSDQTQDRLLAEAISGQAQGRFDLFAAVPHPTFPGGQRLRSPLLALGMLWYRLTDLF